MGMHLERIQNWETLARQARHQAAALARLARVSVRQLERHFQQKHHSTPRAWLIQSRLRHAIEAVRAGQTNKEVAHAVGLQTASSLCRFFRQAADCSPQQCLATLPAEADRNQSPFRPNLPSPTRDLTHFEI